MFMTPWLRSMKSALRPRSSRSARFGSQRRTRRQSSAIPIAPQVELLEDRTLLAVMSSFVSVTNTLEVFSDSDDSIAITAFGSVQVNGQPPDDGALNPATVAQIVVNGGPGGNDIDLTGVRAVDFTSLGNKITVSGNDGNDTIRGSDMGGVYLGGNGNDIINSGGGNDTVDGGNGDDNIIAGDGADSVLGDDGNDTIQGGGGNDIISGGDGADSLLGDLGVFPDTAFGNDTIRGDAGNDTLFGDDTTPGLVPGGNDLLNGGADEDALTGGGGADTLRGAGNNDTLVGGFGNDNLFGQGGHDVLFGGEPIDDTMRNDGEDTLFGNTGNDTLSGGTGNDSLVAAAGDDVLNGNDGDDFLNGNSGSDSMDGGRDKDKILGGSGNDTLMGSFDDDTLKGQGDNDALYGGPGIDSLDGGSGNDVLEASSVQVVFLDFISGFNVGDHIYLNEDINDNGLLDFGEDSNGNGVLDDDPTVIQNLLEADFANYEMQFTQTQPTSGDFVTIVFNETPTTTFPEVPFFGIGEASAIDFRNVALDGRAEVDLNGVLGPLTAGDTAEVARQKFNAASGRVAGKELGHLMGLRNADAFGPLGNNPTTGQPFGNSSFAGTEAGFDVTTEDFLPIFPGPSDATESNLHLMTAPTALETNLNDSVIDLNDPTRDPFFSERSAIKLAFADTGNLERERRPDEVSTPPLKTFANPQNLTLRRLGTPNTMQGGRNSIFEFEADATAVWDGIIRNEPTRDPDRSEDDYYSFTGVAGEIIQIEVHSEQLRRFVDAGRNVNTMLRVLDSSGRPVDYFPGRLPSPLFTQQVRIRTDSAINDRFDDNSTDVPVGSGNFFTGTAEDPIIISFELPTTDTFRVMVSEPYSRGVFAIPANDDPFELNDIVELDPITGVELNRFDAPARTTRAFNTVGGSSVAFDPNLNTLYFANPTRSDQLFSLDPDTGAINTQVTLAIPAGVLPGLHGMALLNSDNLLFVDTVNDDLYRVAPSTGAVLELIDIDNIDANLLGSPNGGTTNNTERRTSENFSPGDLNPEGFDTFFSAGNPFGVGNGGLVGGQFQLVEGIAHDPGGAPPAPNQSPYHIGFQQTSLGNPDDINAQFDFQITTATGDPEGLAFVLGETADPTFGTFGAGPALPVNAGIGQGGFGAGGIEPIGATFNNSLAVVFDSRDNGAEGVAAGLAADNHVSLYLNGNQIATFDPGITLDDGAIHTANIDIVARDTSAAPNFGTDVTISIDGNVIGTQFFAGPDGQEFTTVLGESRALFYSNVDGTTDFGEVAIDNVTVDFRVPLVRNVTAGLAVVRQIPTGDENSTDSLWPQVLILDEDEVGNQVVHEIASSNFTGGFSTFNNWPVPVWSVTSSFTPNTNQGSSNLYGAIGATHLHNNGVTEDGTSVGAQIYLGTGVNTFFLSDQVHAFNRAGNDPPPDAFGFDRAPQSGFTQSLGAWQSWDSTLAPVFATVDPVSLIDGQTNGIASDPAFTLTPQGNPLYNVMSLGSDDNVSDRTDFGNYELFIYRFKTGPNAVDNGVGETLKGGSGDDTVKGGSSNDILRGNAGNDLLDGAAGKDSIFGGVGNDTLKGGLGDDTLDGQGGRDDFFGGDGNDIVIFDVAGGSDGIVEGGFGADRMVMVTGSANDTVRLEAEGSQVRVTVTNPNDPTGITFASQVMETLEVQTNAGDDTVIVGDMTGVVRLQEIVVELAGGDDLLDASGQFDEMVRVAGFGERGNDTLIGGRGNDPLDGGLGADSLLGGKGNDTLIGGDGVDRLFGGDGDDSLLGREKRDVLRGEAGSDTLLGESGNDELFGGPDNDSLIGDIGDDSLFGEGGDDTLLGDAGDDTLDGGSGADTLFGAGGADSLSGGDGNDTLSGGIHDDRLLGGAGNDSLLGGDHEDFLNGNAGDDTLSGGNGKDQLFGGSGQDELDGDADTDTVSGNSGNDSLRGGDGADIIKGGRGLDTLNGGDGDDTLLGGDDGDGLAGDDGDDVLNGGSGVDTLIAGFGDDTLRGGAGGDYLVGGQGMDDLDGQGSVDTLSSGQGFDTITGVADDVIDESIEAFFDPAKDEFSWIDET